jgi:hypothetical protein
MNNNISIVRKWSPSSWKYIPICTSADWGTSKKPKLFRTGHIRNSTKHFWSLLWHNPTGLILLQNVGTDVTPCSCVVGVCACVTVIQYAIKLQLLCQLKNMHKYLHKCQLVDRMALSLLHTPPTRLSYGGLKCEEHPLEILRNSQKLCMLFEERAIFQATNYKKKNRYDRCCYIPSSVYSAGTWSDKLYHSPF